MSMHDSGNSSSVLLQNNAVASLESMGAKNSLKATLPLAERIATASDHCINTGPRSRRRLMVHVALVATNEATFLILSHAKSLSLIEDLVPTDETYTWSSNELHWFGWMNGYKFCDHRTDTKLFCYSNKIILDYTYWSLFLLNMMTISQHTKKNLDVAQGNSEEAV